MKKPLASLSLAALSVAILSTTFGATTALAVTRTWAGTGPGPHNWSVPGNWLGAAPPQAGDDLVFPPPAGTLATNTNNDLGTGTAYNTLTLDGGYRITGNGFHLDAVSPTVALTVGAGQKPVISTGAIFMHNVNANATSLISLGAGSILDMRGTPQLTVGDLPPSATSLVVSGGAGAEFLAPATLDFDTFHLAGSTTLIPQLVGQNGNTSGNLVTDPGTLITTALNAGGTLASSSTMTVNGNLREAVSAASVGGLDFQGSVTFGSTANVSWEAFNSNADNVINFTHPVDLSPASFHILLPPGFQPYAPNAVYPVITSQGGAFSAATEFSNMKEGGTHSVGGYTFTGQYNVPDPGDFRVVVSGGASGSPPGSGLPAPPETGSLPSSPSGPSPAAGALLALAALLLVTGTATFCRVRR